MAEIWKPQSNEVYKQWIVTLREESSEKLTQWEDEFLDSIDRYLYNNWQLSRRQAEILERIYTEKTS